jgi:hypothetical protein
MQVAELRKLRQELDTTGVDAGSSARETGLVTTDRIIFPKCFFKGVLTYWDMCFRLLPIRLSPNQNTV